MKFSEFKAQIDKLIAVYGKDKYPDERVKIFWNKLQNIQPEIFCAAVTNLICNEIFPPMLNKIQDEINNISYKYKEKEYSTGPRLPNIHPEYKNFIDAARKSLLKGIPEQ